MSSFAKIQKSKRGPGRAGWIVRQDKVETTFHDPVAGRKAWIVAENERLNGAGPDMEFGQMADAFMEELVTTVEKNTFDCHRWVMGYLREAFEGTTVRKILPAAVIALRSRLLEHNSKMLAPHAINLLSRLLTYARDRGYLSAHPCENLPPRPLPEVSRARLPRDIKQKSMPSNVDVRIMLSAATGSVGLFVYLALLGGLRIGEALALTWADIDFEARQINVWRTVSSTDPKPKTLAANRFVDMCAPLYSFLRAIYDRITPEPDEVLFVRPDGEALRYKALKLAFYAWQYRLGIGLRAIVQRSRRKEVVFSGQWRPHSLRHAAAAIWIWSGVPDYQIQIWLGHKYLSETLDTYGYLFDELEGGAYTWSTGVDPIDDMEPEEEEFAA